MGQTFNDDNGTFGSRPINEYVRATGTVLNARDRALAGGPGAPNISDVIRLRNQQADNLTRPPTMPPLGGVQDVVGGVNHLRTMMSQALGEGPPGSPQPSISDLVGQVNRNLQRRDYALNGPPPPGNPYMAGAGGFHLTQDQLAQMRDAALNGQANPLFPTIPGTGSGTPNISDIIRAQQTTYLPYNRG